MNQHIKVDPQNASDLVPRPTQVRVLQRQCACGQHTIAGSECAECRKHRMQLLRRATNEVSVTIPPIVYEVLRSLGRPLDSTIRAFMESRFEQDFSQVRVHADAKAAESARSVNALAYTVGQDVVFSANQYAPGTYAGKKLLAHELAHTVQQRNKPQSYLKVGQSDSIYEQQAEAAAKTALHGSPVQTIEPVNEALIQKVSAREEIEWERAHPAGRVERTIQDGMTVIILWNFAVGSHLLKSEHMDILDRIADAFRGLARDFIVVEGHTSDTGSGQRNQTISENRARAAKAYLERQGVFGPQIIADGVGKTDPWVPNDTAENMAKNRRVVITGGLLA